MKIQIRIKKPIGIAKPFQQDGSWRLTIPKTAVKEHDLEEKTERQKSFSYIFLDTNKGLLLVPLDKAANSKNLRDALNFVDISYLSDEDLKMLFEEE